MLTKCSVNECALSVDAVCPEAAVLTLLLLTAGLLLHVDFRFHSVRMNLTNTDTHTTSLMGEKSYKDPEE